MSKNLVFCADGTWNGLGSQDDTDQLDPDATNVLRLFSALEGQVTDESLRKRDELEKVVFDKDSDVTQIAKYLHGVGDSNNAIRRLLGGVFGEGFIQRIVRGYSFLSRNYDPGDRIYLVGFSRGAYTVRALCGMIVKMGLLPFRAMIGSDGRYDPELAYKLGIHVWARFREEAGKLSTLLGYVSEFKGKHIDLDSLIQVPSIDTVAVWDTVGSLGIPIQAIGEDRNIDIFKFADCALSPRVAAGFHALAIDEQRIDFVPTLWDAREDVVQRWFCGAHSDVGGGYEDRNYSSISLAWMIGKLKSRLVQFQPQTAAAVPEFGPMHTPYLDPPFAIRPHGPRVLPDDAFFHPSVQECLDKFGAYDPASLKALLTQRRLQANRIGE